LQVSELIKRGVKNIWLHKGAEGSVLFSIDKTLKLYAPKVNVIDCTGAGDASLAAFIMAKLEDRGDEDSLKIAHTLAAEVLNVKGAIAEGINKDRLIGLVGKYY